MMRKGIIIFGHFCILLGCVLFTLGIYLLPANKPTLIGILTKPLFVGLVLIFGGICANVNACCRSLQKKEDLNINKDR